MRVSSHFSQFFSYRLQGSSLNGPYNPSFRCYVRKFQVVSSLFPANVRDRLFEQDGKKPRKERTLGEALAGDQKDKSNESHHLAAHPAKLRLKNFLHDGPEMSGDGNDVMQSKPIADLVSVFILH